MKGGDSGIESDQMEKKAPVSVKEDDNDALHHYDESLDESILAGHPAHRGSDDETLENEQ